MTYDEALEFLKSRRGLGIKPGLERVKALLGMFGHPEQGLPCIHVAGTNGKGSTSMFLSNILKEAGYKTGLFTSPFIASPTEMFRVNLEPISYEEFAKLIEEARDYCMEIDKLIDYGPTEYEIYAVAALVYFKRSNCQIAVIEACMGGRFDCTNVLSDVEVSIITKLSLEHQSFLGPRLTDIAWHKAGIINQGSPVITYPQKPEALAIILKEAELKGTSIDISDTAKIDVQNICRQSLTFNFEQYNGLELSVPALYQAENSILAIKGAEVLQRNGWAISTDAIRSGIRKARWPGRFEYLSESPAFILDCCHNPDGINAFVKSFKALYKGEKAVVIFGVMKDKAYEDMIKSLSEITKILLPVEADTTRALSISELKDMADKYCDYIIKNDTIDEAVTKSLNLVEKDGIICALGSHFHAESVRKALIRALEGPNVKYQ